MRPASHFWFFFFRIAVSQALAIQVLIEYTDTSAQTARTSSEMKPPKSQVLLKPHIFYLTYRPKQQQNGRSLSKIGKAVNLRL